MLHDVIDRRPVNLIRAHGTGTNFHDPLELAAFEDEFASDDSPPPLVYSHKGALGHSLGAAGMVSVVLSCLMHREAIVPPNVQTREPLPARRVTLNREAAERRIRRSIAVAAGFGGPTAVISLV